MTDRMKRALAAGDVVALLKLLESWDATELQALVDDADACYAEVSAAIDAAYHKALFTPEVFFSNKRAADLKKTADDGQMNVLAACSEISSVALYYLEHLDKPGEARLPAGNRASTKKKG